MGEIPIGQKIFLTISSRRHYTSAFFEGAWHFPNLVLNVSSRFHYTPAFLKERVTS
jgi:hypothetical protein